MTKLNKIEKQIEKIMEKMINETDKALAIIGVKEVIDKKYSQQFRLHTKIETFWDEYRYFRMKENRKRIPSGYEDYPYRTHNPGGYIGLWDSNGINTIVEHRYLMQKHLKRKLNRHEHVHHIDGNTANNNLDNLQVISAGDHTRLHNKKRQEKRRDTP